MIQTGDDTGDRERSVVLVAYRYPPMIGPGSHRAASFARHLPETGWQPVVVTVRGGLFHRDATYRAPPVPTLRTRSVEPSQLLAPLRRIRADRGAGAAGSGRRGGPEVVPDLVLGPRLDRLRRFVIDYLYVPDAFALWIPFAVAATTEALRRSAGPKVLMSTSVPYSSHIACMLVARRERVPWVAEFRDPWAQLHDSIRLRSPTRKRIDAKLEARLVAAADALVVTSDLTRAAMHRAYPSLADGRIQVVRNGYEPVEDPPAPPAADAPLRLVNAGSVPEKTPLEPLLRGIGRVASERPGEVELYVFAPPARWQRAAASMGDPEWLRLAGLVSPQEAQRAASGASANVLLRPGEVHAQYVAAKLMDYLGARRPIIGIVHPRGEMATLGFDYGDMRLVGDYGEEGVAAVVTELLDQHRAGLLQASVQSHKPVEDLTRRAQTLRLAEVLDSVL